MFYRTTLRLGEKTLIAILAGVFMLTAYAAATDIMPDSEMTGKLSTEEEVYDLTLDEAQSLQIDLTSEAFDAYLRLETDSGVIIAEDDDGGNDLNSRMTTSELAPGDYRVVVTSFFGEGSGVYTLSIQTLGGQTVGNQTQDANFSNGEILAAVCNEGDVLANGEGCATCPAMTSFAGEEGPFTLERVYEGSFSRIGLDTGLDEFVASFRGCEPGSFNSGGTVLLAFEPMADGSSVLTQSAYFPGVDTTTCTVGRFSSNGPGGPPDELFCELLFVAQGLVEMQVVNYDFTNAERNGGPFFYTMARATDLSSFGCLDSGRTESSYDVSYLPLPSDTDGVLDGYAVEVELTRQEVAYPSPNCERVALSEAETLSYTWYFAGAAWIVDPLHTALRNDVLTLDQYQEAEQQIQAGEIDDTLAAYLTGRINAEQFASLF